MGTDEIALAIYAKLLDEQQDSSLRIWATVLTSLSGRTNGHFLAWKDGPSGYVVFSMAVETSLSEFLSDTPQSRV